MNKEGYFLKALYLFYFDALGGHQLLFAFWVPVVSNKTMKGNNLRS